MRLESLDAVEQRAIVVLIKKYWPDRAVTTEEI